MRTWRTESFSRQLDFTHRRSIDRSLKFTDQIAEQCLSRGPGLKACFAAQARPFRDGKLRTAELVTVAAHDHLQINREAFLQGLDQKKYVASHAAAAVQNVPNYGPFAPPNHGGSQSHALDEPFARS